MTCTQRTAKRLFDIVAASILLVLTFPAILILVLLASYSCKSFGIFKQIRIGRYGHPFEVWKIRTMKDESVDSTITRSGDPRITRFGGWLRRYKLDELPQLWNIVKGDMSFVGPRPDVHGYADLVQGEDRLVLSVRPGITGPATLKYRNEEDILEAQPDPLEFNNNVIWPDKVRINREYVLNYSFWKDIKYIVQTVSGF